MLSSQNIPEPSLGLARLWKSTDWRARDRKRDWLLSDYHAVKWELRTARSGNPPSVIWDRILPDGSSLLEPQNATLLATGKWFLEILVEDPLELRNYDKASAAVGQVHILLVLFEALVRRGARSFSRISPSEMDELVKDCVYGADCLAGRKAREKYSKSDALTWQAISAYYRVLTDAWAFSLAKFSDGTPLLEDGLLFDPFEATGGFTKLAQKHGKAVGRTRTLEHRTGLLYVDRSIRFVMDYAQELLDLRDRAEAITADEKAKRAVRTKRTRDEIQIAVANFALEFVSTAETRDPSADADALRRLTIAKNVGCFVGTLTENWALQPLLNALDDYAQTGRRETAAVCVTQEARHVLAVSKPPGPKGAKDTSCEAAIRKRMEFPYNGKSEGPAAPWPIVSLGPPATKGFGLPTALNYLWSACYIVIATFTADRVGELLELRGNCMQSTPLGPLIEIVTYKGVGSEAGAKQLKPCPAIVAAAVEVLLRLGKDGPEDLSERMLLAHGNRQGYSLPDDSIVRKRLLSFGEHVGLANAETETAKALNSRELRRWFACVWMWVHEAPDLGALSQHLSHSDLQITTRYAQEAIAGSATIAAEQRSMTNHVMSQLMLGTIGGHGRFGEYLGRLGNRIDVKVMPPEHFEKLVERVREKHGIILRPSPWGYCSWNPARAHKAACRMPGDIIDGSGPNEERRTPTNCGGCINFLAHNRFLFHWEFRRRRFAADLKRSGLPPVWRTAAQEGFDLADGYVRSFREELGLRPIEEEFQDA